MATRYSTVTIRIANNREKGTEFIPGEMNPVPFVLTVLLLDPI
jgi:hypothetical protein